MPLQPLSARQHLLLSIGISTLLVVTATSWLTSSIGVCSADTMFLATCYYGDLDAAGDGVQGADISHRGGPPGFVRVSGAGTLEFADYVGNYTFTTLGDLQMRSLC